MYVCVQNILNKFSWIICADRMNTRINNISTLFFFYLETFHSPWLRIQGSHYCIAETTITIKCTIWFKDENIHRLKSNSGLIPCNCDTSKITNISTISSTNYDKSKSYFNKICINCPHFTQIIHKIPRKLSLLGLRLYAWSCQVETRTRLTSLIFMADPWEKANNSLKSFIFK